MKKRKELNALIGLGDSKRKKTKKGTGHRLLRTEPPDSESESSSDDDEFNGMSSGAHVGKRSYTQCCNVCYPLFLFIILAACVTACAGLIWMQIALKEDLDTLKGKLHSMESSQKVSSSEIPKLSEDLKNKDKKLDDFENGDKGLSKLWSNLTEMNRKISLLDSAVNHLKANLKSAADLVSLPTTVEELEKSVAKIGSTLTSVQHDVKTIQDALENRNKDEELKKTMDIADLRMAVSEANQTEELRHARTDEHVHGLLSAVADLQQRVSSLENGSQPSSKNPSERPATEAAKEAAATTNATPGGAPDVSTPLTEPQTEPQTSRRPRFATPNRSKRNAEASCPEKLILSRVNSLKDLEDIFQQKGVGRDSVGFDFRSLRKVFRTSTPDARTLECFDSDGNQRYSLAELRVAAGL